jgi:hypothetical protein
MTAMRRRLVLAAFLVGLVCLFLPAALNAGVHIRVGWGWGWGGWGWGWGWGWGYPGWNRPTAMVVPAAQLATVKTKVYPKNARLFLNDRLIGLADDFDGYPDYLYLERGHYTLEFRLQGFATARFELDATPGAFYPIKQDLVRVPGEPAAPKSDRPSGLPVGRVFGPHPGWGPPVPQTGPDVGLRPETQIRAEAPAAALPGPLSCALVLKVTPATAAIYVDGTLVGSGEELSLLQRGLAVTAGRHTVQAVSPAYPAKTVEIELRDSERREIVIDLAPQAGQNP